MLRRAICVILTFFNIIRLSHQIQGRVDGRKEFFDVAFLCPLGEANPPDAFKARTREILPEEEPFNGFRFIRRQIFSVMVEENNVRQIFVERRLSYVDSAGVLFTAKFMSEDRD